MFRVYLSLLDVYCEKWEFPIGICVQAVYILGAICEDIIVHYFDKKVLDAYESTSFMKRWFNKCLLKAW